MPVNLSMKSVPDDLATLLRDRAARNHRSLQGELMAIIEQAAGQPDSSFAARPAPPVRVTQERKPALVRAGTLRIEDAGAQMRKLHPQQATALPRAVDLLRELRDRH